MITMNCERFPDQITIEGAHPSIPKWQFYRSDVLPAALAPFMAALERMIIRDFAAVLENKRGISWREIYGYSLANDREDRQCHSSRLA